jgi:hypothetical protein
MPLIAKSKGSGTDFSPIPAGMQQAVCYAIYDIGTQPQQGNFPSRPKVLFCWEVPSERIDIEQDGKTVNLPRAISQKYTLSLNEKGNLRPMLESWRGRKFTAEELDGFDVGKVIGANCLLNIVHANGKGDKATRVYANVASVNPLAKGMAKLQPENPTVVFSMGDFNGPVTIPEHTPEWIHDLITQSDEYITKAQQPAPAPAMATAGGLDDDERVPF